MTPEQDKIRIFPCVARTGGSVEEDLLAENTVLLKTNHNHLEACLSFPRKNKRVVTLTSRAGSPTFIYKVSAEKSRYFHSSYDPKSEGIRWAEEAKIKENSLVVILGGGFFYHVIELLERLPDTCIVVVIERDEEIFQEAMKAVHLGEILGRDRAHCLVGGTPAEAAKFISALQIRNGLKSLSLLSHLPSVETFPEFYEPVFSALTLVHQEKLYDRLRYKKFCREEVRVLLLTTKYFLMGEIISAMQRVGIKCRLTTIEQQEIGRQEFLEEVIKSILDFRPDFIFTINHLGMDREGCLSEFLSRIEMPFASWYVDNPDLIITCYEKNVTPYCALFLWDKNTLFPMQRIGFEHVFYAPLGVDEERFRPVRTEENPFFHLACGVSFVGNSMVRKVSAKFAKAKVNGILDSFFEKIAQDYAQNGTHQVEEVITRKYPEAYKEYLSLGAETKAYYKAAISWEATRVYRLERVKKLLPFQPLIVGDPGWHEQLNRHLFKYHTELSYYEELPYFYNLTTINFNATSRQMKGAVNQRVFDVPACKGFLLTDFQAQLADLYKVGEEIVCYHDPAEIGDLVKYYFTHTDERDRISRRGYERTLSEHTYVRRVKDMVETMKKTFA